MDSSRIERIKTIGTGYDLIEEMRTLSREAEEGNEEAFQILEAMLGECRDPGNWNKHNVYCSAILNALARTGKSRSLQKLVKFVYEMPESMPSAAVALIAALLPLYRQIVVGPARKMILDGDREIVRAVGLQTLCNLFLDGMLEGEDTKFLQQTITDFTEDDYFTKNTIDIVRIIFAGQLSTATDDSEFLEHIDDLLLESGADA